MLGRANRIDATRGPLTRMIIVYAIPLMISSLVLWLLLMAFNVGGFWVVYARFKKGIVKRI